MQAVKKIPIDSFFIEGELYIPPEPKGIILFVHGSGSSRFSPRNAFVAKVLQEGAFATFLVDLLTKEEDQTYETRFNIDLLSKRVEKIIDWLKKEKETKDLSLGLFGASTGAAAALCASATRTEVDAIVSRGGRPDLAKQVFSKVKAPTLFIIGERDLQVISLNQLVYEKLNCEKKMEIVPNATHLFEEPGCLEIVSNLAKNWFLLHLKTKNTSFVHEKKTRQ